MSSKLTGFVKKYRFPAHLPVISDHVARLVSVLAWTTHARLLLAMQGGVAGPGFVVDGRLIIRSQNWGGIKLGRNFRVNSRFCSNLVGLTGISVLQVLESGSIEVADDTGMSGAVISSRVSIRIGSRVNIGGNVRIFDHDFHALEADYRRLGREEAPHVRRTPIDIGDDVFLGTNAIILRGVRLGDRCVVGAGAVVTKGEYPPDSLVAGNPARIMRASAAASGT